MTPCVLYHIATDEVIDNWSLQPKPKYTRVPPPEKQEPSIKFKEAEREAKSTEEWGSGEAGYKVPREASKRMRFVFLSQTSTSQFSMNVIHSFRRNLPYKVLLVSLFYFIVVDEARSTNSVETGAISDISTHATLPLILVLLDT